MPPKMPPSKKQKTESSIGKGFFDEKDPDLLKTIEDNFDDIDKLIANLPGKMSDWDRVFREAIKNGHNDTVQTLINGRINIEKLDQFCRTPLMIAAEHDRSKTVEILLDAGANIEKRDLNGNTTLMQTVIGGHENTVQVLLNAGAKVTETDLIYETTPESYEKIMKFCNSWISHLNETQQRRNDLGINQELLAMTLVQYGNGVFSGDKTREEKIDVLNRFQDGVILLNKLEKLQEKYDLSKVTSLPKPEELTEETSRLSDLLPGIIALDVKKEKQPSHVAALQAGSSAQHAGMAL